MDSALSNAIQFGSTLQRLADNMSDTTITTRPLMLEDLMEGFGSAMPSTDSSPSFLRSLLQEQQELSAVDQFVRDVESELSPEQSRYYSKLLPAAPPGPGEQLAFEVNLDNCSGCKACVTACHSLNGLDDVETWRDVGLMIGGTESQPVMQHVTAACHHCLEPACMVACPVNAYEKSPVTGIVRHLDDQCFGCQYCTLACPYDVPKYHHTKGIVRKCDMCASRLAQGEAPACVQACPHEAIAIRVVDVARVRENAEADPFLPAAPEPYLTFPTTTYKTKRTFPRNLLPADYYSINPQHPHWPLIVMLVLTQLSVGAFAVGSLMDSLLSPALMATLRPLHATAALVLGLLALGASTLHLGRPMYAFRGILGLWHSWLSREILAFGVFAGLAVLFASLCWFTSTPGGLNPVWTVQLAGIRSQLGWTVSAVGGIGVVCSAMIYVFTKRELWNLDRTLMRFGLTTVLLGIATTWLTLWLAGTVLPAEKVTQLLAESARPLAIAVLAATVAKLAYDAMLLSHLATYRNSPLKRSARLVVGVLRPYAFARVAAATLGGIIVPVVFLGEPSPPSSLTWTGMLGVLLMWSGCVIGELMERYLFFAAVSSARMPGGVRP